eukprot:364893-Chlamydomonas_euryale.AAC.9
MDAGLVMDAGLGLGTLLHQHRVPSSATMTSRPSLTIAAFSQAPLPVLPSRRPYSPQSPQAYRSFASLARVHQVLEHQHAPCNSSTIKRLRCAALIRKPRQPDAVGDGLLAQEALYWAAELRGRPSAQQVHCYAKDAVMLCHSLHLCCTPHLCHTPHLCQTKHSPLPALSPLPAPHLASCRRAQTCIPMQHEGVS